ncbi:MAG: fluoride efflux transporter CrcB [Bacteroidaceae bacterium]|nr:fluoride efflux transporter CrcB [Bacteroidaceae bacterium]
MLKDILLVGLGGGVGSMARYALSLAMNALQGGVPDGASFPWATLAANLLGSLLIGLVGGLALRAEGLSASLILLLTTGFCGGFTTFSTFSKESFALLQAGCYGLLISYLLASLAGGLAAVALGVWMGK